jgi:hypothetical protein
LRSSISARKLHDVAKARAFVLVDLPLDDLDAPPCPITDRLGQRGTQFGDRASVLADGDQW